MTRVLLFVLIGITIVIYLLLFAVSRATLPGEAMSGGNIENLLGLPVAIPFALSVFGNFGAVLAVILLAGSVGSEYNWRSIRTMLISSESRLKLLGAKLISSFILILIGMAIGVAVGFVMSLITTAIGGYTFDFSFATGSYLWEQFLQFWRTFYIILPYTLLGFLFSIVGRSVLPGIALGIGVAFLEGILTMFMVLAGGWVAKVPNYLLAVNFEAINALNDLPQGFGMMGGGGEMPTPSLLHAYLVLGGYSLLFILLGSYLFNKRDVTG